MSHRSLSLVAAVALVLSAACGGTEEGVAARSEASTKSVIGIVTLPPPLPPLTTLRAWSDRPLYPISAKNIFTVIAAAPPSTDGSVHLRAYGVDVTAQEVVFNIDLVRSDATGANSTDLALFQRMVDSAANRVFTAYPNPTEGASSGVVGDVTHPGPGPVGPPGDGGPLITLANASLAASRAFYTPATTTTVLR